MGLLIPQALVDVQRRKALKAEIIQNLLNLASKETGRNRNEFVVRDIFPKDDLGFNGCEWENQTATVENTWTRDFYKELPKSKFAAFYGIIDHTVAAKPAAAVAEGHAISGLSYRLGQSGTTVKEQVSLHAAEKGVYLTSGFAPHPIGYHRPVYYKGADTMSIYYLANGVVSQYAGAPELLGMVCEPFGETIGNDNKEILGYSDQTSLGIPEDDLTLEDIAALREETKNRLFALAVKETGKNLADYVARDIFPKDDFGFNGVEWQNQTALGAADAFAKDWSKELPKTQFVGFYGVQFVTAVAGMAGQKYKGIRYALGSGGATKLKQIHLEKAIRGEMTSVGVTPVLRVYHNPVIYKGADTIYVEHMADATTTQYYDGIGNLGLIVEPYGPTISGVS